MRLHTSYARIVGAVIRDLRQSKGANLGSVAAVCGLSSSGYSRLETGDSKINIEQLYAAAFGLGVSPTEILRRADWVAKDGQMEVGLFEHEDEHEENRLLKGESLFTLVSRSLGRLFKEDEDVQRHREELEQQKLELLRQIRAGR